MRFSEVRVLLQGAGRVLLGAAAPIDRLRLVGKPHAEDTRGCGYPGMSESVVRIDLQRALEVIDRLPKIRLAIVSEKRPAREVFAVCVGIRHRPALPPIRLRACRLQLQGSGDLAAHL